MTVVAANQIARGRKAGFVRDVVAVSERALRSVVRDTETTVPALVIPVFMYVMTVGALEDFAESIPGLDYRASNSQWPYFRGKLHFRGPHRNRHTERYFDRLVMTPVNRLPLLLG